MAKRVLVVDDEMHLRLYIKAVFETAGYETAMARNGEEGLAKAREFRPDLVSLDLMMPGEGGIRLFRNLRADPELGGVPVMVVSAIAGGTFEHALRALRAGAGGKPWADPEAYVEKPPTPQSLLDAAARALGGAEHEAAPAV